MSPIDDPIDVLVATDVLSEGQNLQDAHIIVNYDLPWAIIRIIQRAGRVDRVGQQSDTVYVYLISHDKIEQQINLRQRIRARLGASADAFGSDEHFFGGDQEIKILDDFYKGKVTDDAEDADGEADAVSEAWLVWSNAQTKHPQLAKRVLGMQDMIHSTRDQYITETRGGVTCYVSTDSGVDAFATSTPPSMCSLPKSSSPLSKRCGSSRRRSTQPPPSCGPTTSSAEHDLIHGPLTIEALAAGNLKGVRKWVWERLGGNDLYSRNGIRGAECAARTPPHRARDDAAEPGPAQPVQPRRPRRPTQPTPRRRPARHQVRPKPTASSSSARSESVTHDRHVRSPSSNSTSTSSFFFTS